MRNESKKQNVTIMKRDPRILGTEHARSIALMARRADKVAMIASELAGQLVKEMV